MGLYWDPESLTSEKMSRVTKLNDRRILPIAIYVPFLSEKKPAHLKQKQGVVILMAVQKNQSSDTIN